MDDYNRTSIELKCDDVGGEKLAVFFNRTYVELKNACGVTIHCLIEF